MCYFSFSWKLAHVITVQLLPAVSFLLCFCELSACNLYITWHPEGWTNTCRFKVVLGILFVFRFLMQSNMFKIFSFNCYYEYVDVCLSLQNCLHAQERKNIERINSLIKTMFSLSHLPFTILPSLYDCLSFPFSTGVGDLSPESKHLYVYICVHVTAASVILCHHWLDGRV